MKRRLLFSADDIAQAVQRLGREISREYHGKDLVIVAVLKGVFVFLADLIRQLSIPAQVDFVRLASYGAGTTPSGEVQITHDVELDLRGRDVLIVEDIIDTGMSMAFLRGHLLKQQPRSLRICTLLDKTERRQVDVQVDFVGMRLDRGFVVGYGLDCNELYRGLPEIYELLESP